MSCKNVFSFKGRKVETILKVDTFYQSLFKIEITNDTLISIVDSLIFFFNENKQDTMPFFGMIYFFGESKLDSIQIILTTDQSLLFDDGVIYSNFDGVFIHKDYFFYTIFAKYPEFLTENKISKTEELVKTYYIKILKDNFLILYSTKWLEKKVIIENGFFKIGKTKFSAVNVGEYFD